MRYEDSSQAGAFSGQSDGQGPEARDDIDTVAAGARGPVTGNVISGEGTQFGAASSDLSAADAHVTAIAGSGGQDSSFAGGKLSVTGEFGKLNIDADGNYSYLANQGAPENSRDRFTYTLADKQGNSDTAALTIEIGKTPTVVQANAQQVVVGPDGVVILPAGVQLSDIHVVGRNLVINLPDGTQMVIIDGAVFVPQLVLGTVEVPATNLAALLIDSEPRPAAGTPPPSGGGNFGLPPGPLDPGVPLGDLIPPTEMVYTPPEVREVNGILDRKPEIFIDPGNGVPVENAVDSVNEAGLPARNEGEPQGSGEEAAAGANGDPSETTTGTIVYNSPDDPNTITVDGLGLGGPVVITGIGQVIQGQYGTLTITSIADGAIGYSYTLGDNTSGDNTSDPFTVVITDNDGDTDTATLTINIVDDVPTARPDTDSIAAGQFGPATGNVITDAAAGDVGDSDTNAADTVGADNARLTLVSGAGGSDSTFNESGNLVVNGQYGVLTIKADGSYSYVRNPNTPGGVNDVFNYTLTDGDGDTSSSTLTISIGDATPITTPNLTALLDDDAVPLANGNPGGVGDDVDAANLSGTLGASGGDGPLSYDLLLTGAPAGFTYVDGPNGSVLVQQGGTTVLTITINAATGAYTVTQNAPIDHPAGSDENNVAFTINYRVTDQDGDPADGTLNINVDDDTPTIGRADVSLPTLTVDETNLALNATGSVASLFQTSFGADGPGAVTYALAVVNGTDSGLVDVATGLPVLLYNVGGVVTGSTSATLAGVTAGNTVFTASIDANTGVVTLDQIRALDHPANPNPNDPVSPNASSVQAVATVTDGDGDPVSMAVNIGSSLVFLDDGPSVDITLSATAEPTLLTQDTETDGTPTTQDSASASFAANFTVTVNNGADGPGTQAVTYALGVSVQGVDSGLNQGGANIYLYQIGGVVVGSTSATQAGVTVGNTVFDVTVNAAGSVTLTQYSQIDHPIAGDPSATGSPFADHVLSLTDSMVTLTATANVTDGDGDPASDSQLLNIGANLQFADDGPDINAVLTGTLLKLDETDGVGVPGEVDPVNGNLGTITVAAASLLTVSNANISADTPTTLGYTLVLSADGVASGLLLSTTNAPIFLYNIGGTITGSTSATLAGVSAGNTAFTLSVNSGTGAVTMTQFLAVEHSNTASNDEDSSGLTPGVLSIQVTATDFDGDTDQASVDLGSIIRFEDDGPTIDVSVNTQVQEPVLLTQDTETDGTPTTQDSASSAVNFGGVFNLAFTTGSDGAATPTLAYALGVSVQGLDSGLNQGGANIYLYLIGGVVVGSTSATEVGVDAGNTVFNVTVNAAGSVTLTQFSQIDHPIAGDPTATGSPFADHVLSLTDTMVTLTATSTITDNDGDSATDSATVNIGANLQFADDGPDVAAVLTGTLLKLDETDGVGVPTEVDPVGGNLGTITVAAATLVTISNPNVSADTPTTNSYSLVLSAPGVASGLLLSSNNASILLFQVGNTIEGRTGNAAGPLAFTISIDPGTGAVTMTQFLAVEHSNTASNDEDSSGLAAGVLSLRVTATDFDGDTDQASVDLGSIIRFEDDGPSATNDTDIIVGGVGPATGNVMTGVEVAVAEDGNATDGNADNVGSDTPGRISFIDHSNVAPGAVVPNGGSVAIAGDYGVLTIYSNGDYSYLRNPATPGGVNDVFTYTLMDADGDTVTATLTIGIDDNFPTAGNVNVQIDDDDVAGAGGNALGPNDDAPSNAAGNLPGSGGDGALTWDLLLTGAPAGFTYVDGPAGAVHVLQGATHVVTITVNAATGAYTVTQVAPIQHPTLNGVVGQDDTENNVSFTINYTVTDADLDVAPGTININVDDDTPTVDVSLSTAGEPNLITQDSETDGVPTAQDTASASFAANFTVVASDGADGPASPVVSYALGVSAPGVDSGLDQGGANIFLHLIGGVVVGSTSASAAGVTAGNTVFNVSVDAGGTVTLTQFSQIDHPLGGDPTPSGTPFIDHVASLTDTLVTLTATATITDTDGDTAVDSQVLNIGANLRFQDDGPDISAVLTGTQIRIDETDGVVAAGGEVDPVGGNLGTVTVAAASLFTVSNVNLSADTPTTLGYALTLSSQGVASGLLQSASNQPIFLYNIGGVISGSTSATLAGVNAGNTAFTASIDANTGAVTLTQFQAVEHSNPANHDEDSSGLAAGVLNVQITATDFDGDTDQASVDLGSAIRFEDDGPDVAAVLTGTLLKLDETDGVGVPGEVDPVGGNLGAITVAAASLFTVSQPHVSSDTPQTLGYSLVLSADGVASGLLLSTTNAPIFLYNVGGVITGSTSATLAGVTVGNTAFTVSINPGTGAVTMTQFLAVEHPNPANHDEDSSAIATGALSAVVTATDADGDTDTASVDLGSIIRFEDDGPTIDVSVNGQVTEPVLLTQDTETDGTPTTQDTAVSAANFGGVFNLAFTAGSDGAATPTLSYSLGMVAGASGLTQGGAAINLYLISGVVVGSTSATQAGVTAGNTVFDVTVNGSGVVTLTQYSQIDHPIGGDPSATGAPFADHIISLVDSKVTLTASSTITDNDGDTATDSATINIGANLQFADDGSSATIVETGQAVSVDESVNVQVDSNDTTNAGVIALFAGVTNTGTDTHLPQYAQNASAIVGSTGSAYGADGAGTTAFSLNVSAAGVDSGLDTTAGQSILLFKEGALIVGRVSGGADDGKAAFAIAIDPVTGVVSMVEYLSINHPNAADPDDSVSIADGAILAVVTVTDFDGDTATQSVGIGSAIQFQDSAPVMTAASNMNIQNSVDVAHTAAFAFNLGADGPNIATNDVITNVTGSATVGGVPVTNWVLTANVDALGNPAPETATTATYSFSFDYPVGGGATATATGTLVFNKLAGTYTVDLANPIQGVTTILQTAEGTLFQGYEFGTSTPDGSQPAISVTQIQDLAGTANDIYVQFTSVSEPSSGTGDDNLEVTNWVPGANNPPPVAAGGDIAWNAGQLFNQVDGWVSTSGSANGTDGDTIQGGEVLDFNLVQGANPTGVLAQPATFAQASAMFLKFDGIGTGEDMIVILKLYDPTNNTYTTRAIMVENSDIQKGPGVGPGQYSGVTLDNNDGLVIIESNDYNLPGENWVIVGAQIAGSDEGITGTAIDLNGAIGAAGDSFTGGAFDTDPLGFQSDTNDGPFKISSIGFLTTSTTPQNAQLDFNVTVTDGDGDSITQAISATVTAAADSSTPISLSAAVTTINSALPPELVGSESSLSSSNDNLKWNGNGNDKNFGNTGIVAGIVAASGLLAMPAAAETIDFESFDLSAVSLNQGFTQQMVERFAVEDSGGSNLALTNELREPAFDLNELASSSFGFDDFGPSSLGLTDLPIGNVGQDLGQALAIDHGPSFDFATFAPAIGMPGAEALIAAGLTGGVQHGGSVEQVLADALGGHGGAATVDALLQSLPGQGFGGDAGLDALATPIADYVPAWDTGSLASFVPGADMMFRMDVAMLHHDAVQPAVNG